MSSRLGAFLRVYTRKKRLPIELERLVNEYWTWNRAPDEEVLDLPAWDPNRFAGSDSSLFTQWLIGFSLILLLTRACWLLFLFLSSKVRSKQAEEFLANFNLLWTHVCPPSSSSPPTPPPPPGVPCGDRRWECVAGCLDCWIFVQCLHSDRRLESKAWRGC